MDQRKLLEQIADSINSQIDAEEIILFGSRAKGSYNQSSDIDIAVISTDFKDLNHRKRYEKVIENIREVTEDTPVDLKCYTPEEFERGTDSFLPSTIRKEGISI